MVFDILKNTSSSDEKDFNNPKQKYQKHNNPTRKEIMSILTGAGGVLALLLFAEIIKKNEEIRDTALYALGRMYIMFPSIPIIIKLIKKNKKSIY